MYKLSDEKMIWSAQSETLISGNNEGFIKSFVKTIVDRPTEGNLIK